MVKVTIAVVVLIVLLIIGYLIFSGTVGNFSQIGSKSSISQSQTSEQNSQATTATPTELNVVLTEQNASGENGTALLKEVNGKVMVSLNLTGAPTDIPQPAHIHLGACPEPGAVKYPLSNLVNGKSETIIELSMEQLKQGIPLAINVHRSASQAKVYVACGDIKF